MPKRFTQTEKWLDPWFRDLPSEYRFLWIYLCDSCDMAGVWKKDLKAASFFIGCELSGEKALKLFNEEKERVLVINNSKYWVLKDFCLFQYGAFNPKSPIHLRVIGVLTGLGIDTLWGRVGPSLDPRQKEEEEEEEEEKEEEEVKEKEEVKEDRGKGGKKPYGEDGLVMLTAAEFEKLTTRLGETRTSEYVERLQNYIGSNGKRYRSHYHTILNWVGRDSKENENKPKRIRGRKEIQETAQRILEELKS